MKKKYLSILSAVLTLALLGTLCGLGALAEGGDAVEALLAAMSLRDKLAQMMLISPRVWKEDPESKEAGENIRALNAPLRQFLVDHPFGGVVLYGENFVDAPQTLRLVADIQAANREGGGLPMLMSLDQEGGNVARISFGANSPGAMAMAAAGNPEAARRMAGIFGEELNLLNIHADYAPVMDINDNPANPVIGVRAFGDDAATVSEYGCAFLQGLHDQGIIATIKHFPGHGNTDTDSHTSLPLVNRSLEALRENELKPFKAAIDAGADMVMTAHIQYPQIETQTYTSVKDGRQVYIPATMSRTILTDILRGELGFEGVIVSDALEMKAIWDNYALDDMLTMTINAGVNWLMLPAIRDASMLTQIDDMLNRAVALTEAGIIDPARVDDSVRRILTLKHKYGLLDDADFTVSDADIAAAEAGCGSPEHREAAWNLACRALTLLKKENDAFPLKVKEGEKTLILFSAASRVGAGELAAQMLTEMNALPEGAQIESMVIEKDTAQDCLKAAAKADHVLLISRAWANDCYNPDTEDGMPVGVINQVIDILHAAGKTALVVSCQLPYDAACYPEADALLLTFSSGAMRAVPAASGAGSAYDPSLPAAICAAFGAVQPGGRLPVNLPKLDENARFTDELLYARG